MTVEDRLEAAVRCEPEMCSLNMGSMNFGLYPIVDKFDTWKHAWEAEYLESTRDFIFRNTFEDIERFLNRLGEGCGTRFEFQSYDIGHLFTLAHFLDRGLVKPPLFIQSIFGVLGGIGAEPDQLLHMRRTADRLFGESYEWSILAAGRHQMGFGTKRAYMGGNVRVGLEDSLYISKGQVATSNAEQVAKIRRILNELSREIATPGEARERLALKGADLVKF